MNRETKGAYPLGKSNHTEPCTRSELVEHMAMRMRSPCHRVAFGTPLARKPTSWRQAPRAELLTVLAPWLLPALLSPTAPPVAVWRSYCSCWGSASSRWAAWSGAEAGTPGARTDPGPGAACGAAGGESRGQSAAVARTHSRWETRRKGRRRPVSHSRGTAPEGPP